MNEQSILKKSNGKIMLFLIMNFTLCSVALSANDSPRLSPSAFIAKSGESTLDSDDAIRYSLLFSGVSEETLSNETEKIKSLLEGFEAESVSMESEKDRAEKILVFLHKRVLKQYSENQTLIDVVFSTGKYNCVSSAVLYMILAQYAGLKVMGVKTKDHVFCKVEADGREYDVETTNPYGFDPGSKKDFIDSFGNVTGYSYVSPANYSKRKDISETQLIAVILHNRVSYLEKAGDYSEAVGLAVDSYYFTEDADSNEILVNAITNMGAWYNLKKKYLEGLSFFDIVTEQLGKTRIFEELISGLTNNMVILLLDEQKYDEADSFVADRLKRGNISETEFADFSVSIALVRAEALSKKSYKDAVAFIDVAQVKIGTNNRLAEMKGKLINNWIAYLINGKMPEEAIGVIEKLRSKKDIGEPDYIRYVTLAHQVKAEMLSKEKGELEAARYLKEVMAILGSEAGLVKMHERFISSFEIKTHNSVVPLFNSGKYLEAKKILEDALSLIPGSKKIKDDLEKVKKMIEKH